MFSRILKEKTELIDQDMLDLTIENNNRIYQHQTLRVNYTSYDLQRHSDLINVWTRPDLMVLSAEGDHTHPYQYGRLIDIFTVPIYYKGPRQILGTRRQKLQVLWVRWFKQDIYHEDGFTALRLLQLSFANALDHGADGLINPTTVLRATHLIPAFEYDSMDLQPLSNCYATRFLKEDWNHYYVNMYVPFPLQLHMQTNECVIRFVDRDMFMRHRGGGVGHTYMREIEKWLSETGWGHEIPDVDESEPHTTTEDDLQQEDPMPNEDDSDSGAGSGPDDPQSEEEDSELEDEETVEGEFGYSTF